MRLSIIAGLGLTLASTSAFAAYCPKPLVLDPLHRCVCPAGYTLNKDRIRHYGRGGPICLGGAGGDSYNASGVPVTVNGGRSDGSSGGDSPGGGTPGGHSGGGGDDGGGGGDGGGNPGLGNPGNDHPVGHAGENPNGQGGWGSGSQGHGDTHGNGHGHK